MKSIDFSVIIPNLNGAKLLPNCLNSLLTAISKKSLSVSGQPTSKFETILVDNASTDNSIFLAKKIHPEIKIISNTKNLGFAKAINQGAGLARYPWIVPCNNDIKLNKNWFKIMSKAMETNPDISSFFGTIKNKSGASIESTGLKFSYSGKCLNCRIKKTKQQVIWGGNAGLIIYQKKVFQSLDGFDSDFFAYLEDVDFNLRLNKAGHRTLLVPTAISYHLGGATSQKFGNLRHQKTVQNWIYIIVKNYSLKQIFRNLPGIIEQRLRNLSGLLKNTPFLFWLPTLISIYGQVIINSPIMFAKRKK